MTNANTTVPQKIVEELRKAHLRSTEAIERRDFNGSPPPLKQIASDYVPTSKAETTVLLGMAPEDVPADGFELRKEETVLSLFKKRSRR